MKRLVRSGLIVLALTATASCATAQDQQPRPPVTAPAPPPPPPPPADVRISAPSTMDAVAVILAREPDAERAAVALVALTNARFAAGDAAGAGAAIEAAVQVVETRLGPDLARVIAATRLPPAHADAMTGTHDYAGFLIRHDRPAEALVRVRAGLGELLGQEGRGRDWPPPGPSADRPSAR